MRSFFMEATLISDNKQRSDIVIQRNFDAFFYINKDTKEAVVLAIHVDKKGNPVFIIDRRNNSNVKILVEKDSEVELLVEDKKVKGKKDAEEFLDKFNKRRGAM